MIATAHNFAAQCVPLNRNRIVCLNCGKVIPIGSRLGGRRRKCSKTRKYVYLGNGATASRSTATGKMIVRSLGHAEYRCAGPKP